MVDTNHVYGSAEALLLGRALADYKLRWYEEPVVPEDLGGYAEMRDTLTTPIVGGENEHTLFGFRELFANHAVDIAQPDIGFWGGITAAKHITALAQAEGIAVNPHVGDRRLRKRRRYKSSPLSLWQILRFLHKSWSWNTSAFLILLGNY